jgi:5-methyltetrahydrofolate--homocysteine methyltransferase
MPQGLVDAMAGMKEQEALGLAKDMLDGGQEPLKILDLCREAVEIVGKRFEQGKYFLPALMTAGEMLKQPSIYVSNGLEDDRERRCNRTLQAKRKEG